MTCFMIVRWLSLADDAAGFAKDVLLASPGELGLLMSLMGVGALSAPQTWHDAGQTPRPRLHLGALIAHNNLAFALSTNIWLSAVIVLAIGVGQSLRMSLSNVLIPKFTETQYRGRVMSVYMMEFSPSRSVRSSSVISNLIGVQAALAGTGLGLIVLARLRGLRTRMRNLA